MIYNTFGVHTRALILGIDKDKCIVRTWAENDRGEIVNYDNSCLIPQGYNFVKAPLDIHLVSNICNKITGTQNLFRKDSFKEYVERVRRENQK